MGFGTNLYLRLKFYYSSIFPELKKLGRYNIAQGSIVLFYHKLINGSNNIYLIHHTKLVNTLCLVNFAGLQDNARKIGIVRRIGEMLSFQSK